MRRAVAIYGATEETLSLVPMLEDNPSLEVAAIYDADLAAARARAAALDPATRDRVLPRLTDDRARLLAPAVRAGTAEESGPACTESTPASSSPARSGSAAYARPPAASGRKTAARLFAAPPSTPWPTGMR